MKLRLPSFFPCDKLLGVESLTIRRLVRNYLQGLLSGGCSRVTLEDEVRPILRAWMIAARNGSIAQRKPAQQATPRIPTQTPAQSQPQATPQQSPPPTPEEDAQAIDFLKKALSDSATDENPEPPEEKMFFRPAGSTHEEIREQAKKLLLNWEPLKQLGSLRDIPVWGDGPSDASMFFVGDAPNFYDEKSGLPFSGEAGTKLDEMLRAMGLSRREIYLTHMVKLRPATPHQTLNNRTPNAAEISAFLPMLEFEIGHVRPRVIVALGVVAARGLLRQGELPLSAYQNLHNPQFNGIPVVVTHHPSYLLRTTQLSERRRLWEEMLRAMEIAGLPISDKQRRFFLPNSRTNAAPPSTAIRKS